MRHSAIYGAVTSVSAPPQKTILPRCGGLFSYIILCGFLSRSCRGSARFSPFPHRLPPLRRDPPLVPPFPLSGMPPLAANRIILRERGTGANPLGQAFPCATLRHMGTLNQKSVFWMARHSRLFPPFLWWGSLLRRAGLAPLMAFRAVFARQAPAVFVVRTVCGCGFLWRETRHRNAVLCF